MTPQATDVRSYLRWLVATVLLASSGIAALVMLVDPYGLHHHAFERAGFNLIKPALAHYQNEIKLSHALALKPDILILGNSRAEIGFDPEGDALSGTSAYNLAIAGTGISVARGQLEYLDRIGRRPKLVVLGLEFLDFIVPPGSQSGIAAPGPPVAMVTHPIERGFWRFDSVFSIAALQDALRTMAIQRADDPQTMTARGFNPLNEYRALARSEGYYPIFRQRAEENAANYLKKAQGSTGSGDFAQLDAILALAAKSGIEIKLIVYPYHAQTLALFEASGLWPAFEQWKERLAAQSGAWQQRFPAARIALFDFSGYSAYACERIPARDDHQSIPKWYWEGGHFKKALGELILTRLQSNRAGALQELPGSVFGIKLEPENAAANRRRIAQERASCLRAYPALFEESANLVAAARKSSEQARGQ